MIAIPSLNQLPDAVARMAKDTWAQMTALFLEQHDEDGNHTNVTAYSLSMPTDLTGTGATGNLTAGGNLTVGGTGVFNGNVTADADGSATGAGAGVVIGGGLGPLAGPNGPGIDIDAGGSGRWDVIAATSPIGGGPNRALAFLDRTAVLQVLQLWWDNAGATYRLSPVGGGLGGTLTLGDAFQGAGAGRWTKAYLVDLDASGNAVIGGNATVTGNGTVSGTLAVTGTSSLSELNFNKQELQTGSIAPAQITADQNNYNPTGLATARHVRITSDALRNLTGLVAQPTGTVLTLWNVGLNDIVLKHNSGNSSGANIFACPGLADFTLNTSDAVDIRYDESGFWRVKAY
jgi:hypothetical protein